MLNNFETQQHQLISFCQAKEQQFALQQQQFDLEQSTTRKELALQQQQLQLKEQQLIADYKGKEQQLQMKEQLLDIRNEKLNNREDNLLIREEQMKIKEARLDLQDQHNQGDNATNNININSNNNNTHHILALFEQGQQLVSLQERLSHVPIEVWDQVEIQQQRRLLEEDKAATLLAYHGLQDHLDEQEKALEKKLKKLNKLHSHFAPKLVLLSHLEDSLNEREIALQTKENELNLLSKQPLKLLPPQIVKQVILHHQLDFNKQSTFHHNELQANDTCCSFLFRLVSLKKNAIVDRSFADPCREMFFLKDNDFHKWFATDSKAGLLPTEDSGHKIYFASPHVLNGEWVQVFGEGTDTTLFDPETFTLAPFINKARTLLDKATIVHTDGDKGCYLSYSHTLDIKWE